MSKTITFVGAGNMATSIIGGLIQDGYDPQKIWATNPSIEKLSYLQQHFMIHTTTDNSVGVSAADVVVLAVKPQKMREVVESLATELSQKLILSIAVGVRADQIHSWVGSKPPIVRAMPNTPELFGKGATGLFASAEVSQEDKDFSESILRAVGVIRWVDKESLLDVVGALSASGPAYFFLVTEALMDAAEKLGLSREDAELLSLQTAYGASLMALEVDEDIKTLRAKVTSAGGTTQAAIKVLEDGGIRTLFKKALIAADNRAKELAENHKE